ncbi:diguanylate cyclase [Mammaliicoccus sciuri]
MVNESDFFQINPAFPPTIYNTIIEEMKQGVFVTDESKNLLFANSVFFTLTQYNNEDPSMLQLFPATWQHDIWEEAEKTGYWEGGLPFGENGEDGDVKLFFHLDTTNDQAYYYGICRPASMINQPTSKGDGCTDPLTKIGNRNYLTSQMDKLFCGDPERKKMHAVLFLDLDRFKQVNDTMGHFVGDELLKEFTRRVKKILRKNDLFARLGGDEFVIVQTDIKHEGEAVLLADRIFEAIEQPYHSASYEVGMSTSIGISLYPKNGTDRESLMRKSDVAMYESKRKGRNRQTLFEQDLEERIANLQELEQDLIGMVENKDFQLLYEPKLHLGTGMFRGAEISLRCGGCKQSVTTLRDSYEELVEMGLDIPITNLAIERICEDLSRMPEAVRLRTVIAVDISSMYFTHPQFIQNVCGILGQFDVKPENFELELDEKVIMLDEEQSIHKLRTLKKLGFHLLIDHFGYGYSSIPLLSDSSIGHLKLDRNLVKRLSTEEDQWKIAQAIKAMAGALEIDLSFEGVDDVSQCERLRALGCSYAQGTYISKPLEFDEFLHLIQ